MNNKIGFNDLDLELKIAAVASYIYLLLATVGITVFFVTLLSYT